MPQPFQQLNPEMPRHLNVKNEQVSRGRIDLRAKGIAGRETAYGQRFAFKHQGDRVERRIVIVGETNHHPRALQWKGRALADQVP